MALPRTVRVKLSSEAAEAISLTPVVVQEFALRELIEHLLAVAGKDEPRLCEILLRGTLVSGASRFRWAGWEVEAIELREVLATFPDPEPLRPFAAERCVRATLQGGRQVIEIPREVALKKGLFQRQTFWDALLQTAAAGELAYAGYSYRDRGDRYVRRFDPADAERIRASADKVPFSTLRAQIRACAFTQAELLTER